MRIFLAGIIQGSLVEPTIHSQDWREPIKQVLARHLPGAEIYCHYTRHPDSIRYDLEQIRSTMAEGNRLASECDVLVANVPSASMGTAVEMYLAARGGAVVLTISPLAANWVIRLYSDRVFATLADLEEFLRTGQLDRLMAAKRKKPLIG